MSPGGAGGGAGGGEEGREEGECEEAEMKGTGPALCPAPQAEPHQHSTSLPPVSVPDTSLVSAAEGSCSLMSTQTRAVCPEEESHVARPGERQVHTTRMS